jgi:hypothetical protein
MATDDNNASFLEDSRNEIDTELFLKLSATNDGEPNQGFLMCNDDNRTKGFLLCFDPTNNVCAASSEGLMSFFKRESWSTATVKGSKESASASSTASVQGGGSSANSSLASVNEEKEEVEETGAILAV